MKATVKAFRVFAFLIALAASVSSALGQAPTGRILGTVTDPNGGVIAGAKIAITNVATQIRNETVADHEGNFQVLDLPIGVYRIDVEKDGFRKAVFSDQTLTINKALRIEVHMELGASSESVEVTTGVVQVDTVSATIGQTMTGSSITTLPLNGRNTYDLALLLPGVVEVNPDSGAAGNFGVAGGRSDSVTYLLDGGVNNNLLSNGVVYNPNPDTIAEFRILTSNYNAEYGRNAGGIVSAVTKSGTNQYHGGLFDFVRNDAFNANSFFNNLNSLPREILKRNQFGGNVGGPISVPHVLHGQDRMFFFVSYQGQRQVQTVTTNKIQVFKPAEIMGDFSHSAPNGGVDPRVACFLSGLNHNQPNPTNDPTLADGTPCTDLNGNVGLARTFFQSDSNKAFNGVIDPTRINSVAANYIGHNLVPTSASGFLIGQGGSQDNRDELTGKFDFQISSKDKISTTFGSSRNPTVSPFRSTLSDPLGYGSTANLHTYFANVDYSRTFSSNVINEFRFTTQRNNRLQAVPIKKLSTPADLGIGITPDQSTGPTRIFFDTGLGLGFSSQGPTNLVDNTFTWSDTLSWVHGKHNWKYGGSASWYQDNTLFDFFVDGEFDFDGGSGIGSINSYADFLLGLTDFYLQFGSAPSNIRTHSLYGFAQDEWHVRKNLTLTLGLRYEYSSPKLDTQHRSFSLHLGQQSTVFPNAPTGLLFPGDAGAPIGANLPDKNDWAPRFGFAWSPGSSGKTSVRGGIGIFYDILKGEDNLQFNGQAPFFGFAFLGFNPIGNPSQEVNYLTQPFVSNNTGTPNSFPSKPPAKNIDFGAAGFLPFGGSGVFFVDPHLRTPYVYQYNLSVQREVAKNTIVEASYVGNSDHKLTSLVDANPFTLGTTTRIFNAAPGSSGNFSFLPEFQNVSNGNYNSLEASLQKQPTATGFLGNIGFILSYTFGHEIDNSSGFRQRGSEVPFYNHRQFRTSGDFDVKHRISFSGNWDLPFDHALSSAPKRLTKGWTLAPIFTFRTGFPLDVFGPFSQSGTSTGPSGAGDRDNVRANFANGTTVATFQTLDPKVAQTLGGTAGNFYFDPTGFNTNGSANFGFPTSAAVRANLSLATYGTVPRNFFRGPSRTNLNLALIKETALFKERTKLTFRAEFFNIFNHTEFSNPDTGLTSGTFGQILSTADPRIIQLALKLNF